MLYGVIIGNALLLGHIVDFLDLLIVDYGLLDGNSVDLLSGFVVYVFSFVWHIFYSALTLDWACVHHILDPGIGRKNVTSWRPSQNTLSGAHLRKSIRRQAQGDPSRRIAGLPWQLREDATLRRDFIDW